MQFRTVALSFAFCAAAAAQPFNLIVTISPPGSLSNPANWQAALRFGFPGTGGAASPLPSIPTTQVFDPAGVTFRTPNDVFIGNRHGNVLGQGSISRFTLSADGSTATFVSNTTAPGLVGVHEMAYNALTDEIFATTVNNGIFRFRFNASNQLVFVGSFASGQAFRGIQAHPNGLFVYASTASSIIRRFRLEDGGGVTELPPIGVAGAQNLHFFSLSPNAGQLYVADINTSRVYRFDIEGGSDLVPRGFTSSPSAIDLAFSPDGTEMFVGNHIAGGITRYTYNSGTESWIQSGFISTPSMGGFGIYNPPYCLADLDDGSGTGQRDGGVTIEDLLYFLQIFDQGLLLADVDDGSGTGQHDGGVTIEDLLYFLGRFDRGC